MASAPGPAKVITTPATTQDSAGTLYKSGGVRIIYYVHSDAMPLYLLTMFAKNERANLTRAECNELAGLVDLLVQIWFER